MDNEPLAGEQRISRLKDLAERLLDYDYEVDSDAEKPRLFLGELPEDLSENLPAEIPIPEDLTLLGGLLRKYPWRSEEEAEIILETEKSPEAARDSLRDRLADSRWSEKRWRPAERGGFVSTGGPRLSPLIFCLSQRGPSLLVSCYPRRKSSLTEIRIRLEGSSGRDSTCSEEYGRFEDYRRSVIPALYPSEGMVQLSGGGGSGTDSEENSATVKTDLSPTVLVEHYSTQLAEGGWMRVGGGGEGPTSYSGWEFEVDEGDAWVGMLVALGPPGASELCFLQISASRMPKEMR
ncbi:MAG: hypothetical protein ACR2GU_15150 [Rubrobacteraceae bacterium]